VYNNSVYIGSATDGEPNCPLIPAQLDQLNVATGQIQHTFNVVPNGCLGGGIWTSPTLDTSDNSIYITTGTQGSFHSCKEPYAIAMVKVRASDLSYIDSWQIPPALRGDDSDFGATPTLFNATIGGVTRKLVGAINKNGIYYAFDRTALHNGPVWTAQLAEPGDCPQCGKGSISSSAWNGTALFVATTKTTVKGKTCAGSQRALNPATGASIWERCLVDGAVLGAVSMVPGVVAVVAGPDLVLLSSVSGKTLFNSKDIGVTGLYGSASISHGVLYVGSTTKKLYAFGT
jgi:outer membrane protein assembly factor BamB